MTAAQAMQQVLADMFAMYFKAHAFHWNVEGQNFDQYHKFLGELYEEIWEALDEAAEQIRTLDHYPISDLGEMAAQSQIRPHSTELNPFPAQAMFMQLAVDNQRVIDSLTVAAEQAEAINNRGLTNFVDDRIQVHQKHGWMLRAIAKRL
jgi:starvation-inducible DNA-binding protein